MSTRPNTMRSRSTGAAPASSKPKPADPGARKVVRVVGVPQLSGKGGTTTEERALWAGAGSPISAASKTALADAGARGRAVAQAPARSRIDTQVRTVVRLHRGTSQAACLETGPRFWGLLKAVGAWAEDSCPRQ